MTNLDLGKGKEKTTKEKIIIRAPIHELCINF